MGTTTLQADDLDHLPVDLHNREMKQAKDPSGGLEAAVIELSLAIGQLRRRLRSEASPLTLNLSQLGTLVRLEQNGWSAAAELARAESMKPQSMSEVLKSLEKAGLVKRRAHPTDGRQIQFALTDAGLETRQQRKIAKRDWLLGAMSKLSSEEFKRLVAAIPIIKRLGDD
ncbi:MarR family transcriptional regulator [Sphingomonas oligophenolica]|uniref:MarR family transcriptional regulator n=1 Tax=Sphingomonas oligophenolica TaxID=301154 RepID=A0ABU9YCT8_9SPHN